EEAAQFSWWKRARPAVSQPRLETAADMCSPCKSQETGYDCRRRLRDGVFPGSQPGREKSLLIPPDGAIIRLLVLWVPCEILPHSGAGSVALRLPARRRCVGPEIIQPESGFSAPSS